MTSLVSPSLHIPEGSPSLLASLEPAISRETRDIAQRVEALRSRSSPGTITPQIDGTTKKMPFEESVFDALAVVKILTSQVTMHLDGEWRTKLFRQLDSLHDPAEWEEGDQPLRPESFKTFLKAILAVNPERRPGLGLADAGNLIAAWTTGKDRLTVEFMPRDRVRWVLSRHYDDGAVRYVGDTPVAHLKEDLASHHPQHWFSRAPENREHS